MLIIKDLNISKFILVRIGSKLTGSILTVHEISQIILKVIEFEL